MAKAPQPRRIGIDLGEKSVSALVLRPDGRLENIRVAIDGEKGLDGALAGLPAELFAAPVSSPQLGSGEGPSAPEVVLTSSRALATLRSESRPRVALLVTEGFEDLLVLHGEAIEPASWPFDTLRLADLCPRERCLSVQERLSADGSVLRPLTADGLGALRQRITELQVSAIAVVLLHSYQNDAHERTVAEALAPLGLPISISSAVARVPDERRRAAATLLDACLQSIFTAERAALRRAGCRRLLCSDSAGDVAPAEHVGPLRQLYAAVAVGLRGAQRIAVANGLPRFLALHIFDSFAAVALHDPELLADAPRQLGPTSLFDPFLEIPAQELRIVELAEGASETARRDLLCAALEAISVERGHDPAAYPLLCYGDIETALATAVGEQLGAQSARILPAPSRVVAYGALCAPLMLSRRERLCVEASSAQQNGQISAMLHALTNRLREEFAHEGYVTSAYFPGLDWLAELRYHGKESQSIVLLGLGDGGPAVSGDTDLVVRFCAEHKRRYGFILAECPVEIVALQVRVTLPVSTPSQSQFNTLSTLEASGKVQPKIA